MQEQISKVELVLENCESVAIDGKYIGDLRIEDIKRSISRIACNAIFDMSSCDHFSMSINRKAEDDKNASDGLFDAFGDEVNHCSPFTRINKWQDITSVYIHFTDSRVEQFYVKWSDDEYNNHYQKSHINKFGDLFIVINKDIELGNVFDLDEIDDQEHMDFIWSMYS